MIRNEKCEVLDKQNFEPKYRRVYDRQRETDRKRERQIDFLIILHYEVNRNAFGLKLYNKTEREMERHRDQESGRQRDRKTERERDRHRDRLIQED